MKTVWSLVLTILALQAFVVEISTYEIQVTNRCGFPIFVKSQGGNSGSGNLNQGQSLTTQDSTRVWAHKGCDGGGNNCNDNEGEVSLAEMHWDGSGKTWYDISQVDGYNLPITIQPYNPNGGGRCETVGCNYNINSCPDNSKVYRKNQLVACKNPNRDAVTDYSRSIKAACPNVYSWSKDDAAGMRDCNPGNNGLRVIFC